MGWHSDERLRRCIPVVSHERGRTVVMNGTVGKMLVYKYFTDVLSHLDLTQNYMLAQ